VLLIVGGILALAQTILVGNRIDTENVVWATIWSVVFTCAGLAFAWVFFSDPQRSWWAAIPGLTFLALAILVSARSFGWDADGTYLGALFLGMIGLSFWVIYVVKREFWWAVIPGGTLLTLAAVTIVSQLTESTIAGAVFFFGLALTFGLLMLLPREDKHMTWPLIPCAMLTLMGFMVLFNSGPARNYGWPVALIAVGLYLLYRQFRGETPAGRHR